MASRQSVRVPSYRHHRPSGQAVVTLGGHDIYLGKWQSSKSRQEYRRLVAEWLVSDGHVPEVERSVTVTTSGRTRMTSDTSSHSTENCR
jgi:hypothetical protein